VLSVWFLLTVGTKFYPFFRYDRTWGHLFSTFEEFLAFSWPVITVTDDWTGRPHIVTRYNSIGAFLKMMKTRFGETLPVVENMLQVTPFENTPRHLRTVSDWPSYKKIHSTLPAVVLAALKIRVRSGEPKAIRELWEKKDKAFLAIDFEWSERNSSSCLEWGFAAMRCGHLEALNHWPPVPDTNYRKGHYIVGEYVDKVINKHCPTFPWMYAFGESQVISKAKLPQIIQSVISSLASPDSETTVNSLVLVGHGINGDLSRLEEMKIKLPHNVLIIDTATFERALFTSGLRGPMLDSKTSKPRAPGSTLSLENLLRSLNADVPCARHNAGNDAFMSLVALQLLLDPENTKLPTIKQRIGRPGMLPTRSNSAGAIPVIAGTLMVAPVPVPLYAPSPTLSPGAFAHMQSAGGYFDAAGEFGQMRRSPGPQRLLPGASTAIRGSRSVGFDAKGGKGPLEPPTVAMYGMSIAR
jgi:hypothetical protein